MVTRTGPTQGLEASGFFHVPFWLLPSLRRPTSLSALSPAEASAKRTHSDLSAYTVCTRAIPCLCPWHVPRRTELSNLHTSPLIPV